MSMINVTRRIRTSALGSTLNIWMVKPTKSRCSPLVSHHLRLAAPLQLQKRPCLATLLSRTYQNLAPKNPSKSENPVKHTISDQRKTDWSIITKLIPHVWPRNDWHTRGRVLFAFGLLVSGKVR